jgi:hypothetical protein
MSLTKVHNRMIEKATVSVLDFGAVGDGVTDDTAAIQSAIDHAIANDQGLIFPRTSGNIYLVDEANSSYCLLINGSIDIEIESSVTIQTTTTIGVAVAVFRLNGASNTKISGYGATILGKRASYSPQSEGRHAFYVDGGQEITIQGIKCLDMGSDGVYLGGNTRYVTVKDVTTDNCRRNGISITAARNILIEHCKLLNTNGVDPQMGIDIEPNNNNDFCNDIIVKDCFAYNNTNHGYNVSPSQCPGTNPYTLTVDFINCVDDASGYGFGAQEMFVDGDTISGHIKFINCHSRNAEGSGFSIRNYDALGVPIIIEQCSVIDANQSGSTTVRTNAPFSVYNESADSGPTNIGNVHLYNPRIVYTGTAPNITDFHFHALSGSVTNCSLIDPLEVGHPQPSEIYQLYTDGYITLSDRYETMVHEGTETIQLYALGTHYTQSGSAPATFTLPSEASCPDLVFYTKTAFGLTIDPDAGSVIYPLGTAAGKYITTTNVGATVTLRRVSSTQWRILNITGTWTNEP